MSQENFIAKKLFGFALEKNEDKENLKKRQRQRTFVSDEQDDGALIVEKSPSGGSEATSVVSQYGLNITLESQFRDDVSLITKYREMGMQPEIETAVDDIINESIVTKGSGECVSINLDDCEELSDKQKKIITEEFKNILRLLNFNNLAFEIYKRWYIDGRIYYHIIRDETDPKAGIKELRYIDPRKIKKVRQVSKEHTDLVKGNDTSVIRNEKEFYLYSEIGIINSMPGSSISTIPKNTIPIEKDSIAYVTSSLTDPKKRQVISYLHKAIKPLNNLRLLEDSTVIYRISRAPERRVFYIDVANIPARNQEAHLKKVMNNFRNRLTYNATTGALADERNSLAMIEDFWMPRTSSGRTSEIDTLPAGQNLGNIEDVEYFQKKLYRALNIPYSRTQSESGFNLGRGNEITRDEIKFSKFVDRLRRKFGTLFSILLKVQLVSKDIISTEDWDILEEKIWFDFLKDNNYEEMKEADIWASRFGMLQMVDPYVGKYVSKEWVMKNVMRFDDEEIEEMNSKMQEEIANGEIVDPTAAEQMQFQQQANDLDQQQAMNNMDLDQKQQAFDLDMSHKQEKHDFGMSERKKKQDESIKNKSKRTRDFAK